MLYLKRKFLLHRLMEDKVDTGGGGDQTKTVDTTAGGDQTKTTDTTTTGGDKGGGGDKTVDTSGAGAFGDWNKTTEAYVTARKGDDKLKGRLTRYNDAGALIDAHLLLQEQISKGEFKRGLKADAKPEDVTKWRAENDIPESADKYALKLGGDMKVMKGDEPYVGAILNKLHGKNANNEMGSAAVEAFYEIQTQMRNDRQAADSKVAAATEHALRVEWGGKYEPNINDINAFLGMAPKSVQARFIGGRLADGTPIIHDPDTKRWLLSVARQSNPVSAVVPLGSSEGMASAIDAEIKLHETNMRAPKNSDAWKAYYKDNDAQQRYRDLLDARDGNKKKT